MTGRRSSFQIAVDVLTIIAQGEKQPTRIMYAANLSWDSINRTLALLLNKGYVDEEYTSIRKKQYSVTSKGFDALRYYENLESLIKISV